MAKFNVILGVQYQVEAGNPSAAYNDAVSRFSRTQSSCDTNDMAARFDGLQVTRVEPVPEGLN